VADRFYLHLPVGGFWTTTDGGENWTRTPKGRHGAPPGGGSLAVNEAVANDLWLTRTWNMPPNPAFTGVYHSTDGGTTWSRLDGPLLASGVALGKGRGQPGDAPFTVYFYGTITGDDRPGMFRSTDAGQTWQRISYYPNGLFVQTPDTYWSLAASWDEFGVVAMNTGGQGWVFGKPR
jgi:photosystem II stability/assembly factor-like uncharacterized protein